MRKLCRPGFSYVVTVKKKESNLNYTVLTRVILKALLIIPLINNSSYAVDEDYFAEDDFFGDSPIVLTVSRIHKPLSESPVTVSIIDRQMIKNSGAREVAEIFRMIPGFFVGHNTYNGSKPVVVYHGLGTQFYKQFQVMIDGRSVFIPTFGGVPWENLPLLLEDIERVEVTRGPNAVTYGANAFLATINIITRHSAEDSGIAVSYINDLDGSSKTQDLYVRLGNQIDDLDWRVTAGRETDDGNNLFHDSNETNKLNIRTDFLTAYNQFWTIQAGINEAIYNLGDGDPNNIERDEISSSSYQNIKWELIEDRSDTTVKFYHSRRVVTDHFETPVLNAFFGGVALALPDFTGTVSYDRYSDRLDFEAFQNRKLGDYVTINYGLSFRKEKISSFYLFHDEVIRKIDTERAFSSLEWKPLEDLTFDIGFMLEKSDLTEREASSRLSMIKKIENHSIRVVSSNAKRNPVLWEFQGNTQFDINVSDGKLLLLPVWKGNSLLKPEDINSAEIGFFSNLIDHQLTTDLRIFTYSITDQLVVVRLPNPPVAPPVFNLDNNFRMQTNAAETKVDGYELSVNYSPTDKSFRIYGGYSHTSTESNETDYPISFPSDVLFVGGHTKLSKRAEFSAHIYAITEFHMDDATTFVERYTKADMRYQYTIDHKSDTKLELIFKNLHENYDDYGLGREQEQSYLLRVSSQF